MGSLIDDWTCKETKQVYELLNDGDVAEHLIDQVCKIVESLALDKKYILANNDARKVLGYD